MSSPVSARAYHQIEMTRPGDIPPRVFDFLTDLEFPGQLSASATRIGNPDTGDWHLVWLVETPIDQAAATAFLSARAGLCDIPLDFSPADLKFSDVPDCNWLKKSYRGFPPFTVGRFALRGRHDAGEPVPPLHIPILIDAVTAFGSGEHPTTRGCLILLDQMAQKGKDPARILDLGTGSGILAIAAHKLWPGAEIIAVDNDPEAVRVAAEYAGYNEANGIIPLLADTPAHPDIAARGPFDLITANILAGPLQNLASAIAGVLTKDGRIILSGLLQSQSEDVLEAYKPFGFDLKNKIQIDDWAALELSR